MLAITHVTVVPMDAPRRLPDHTVIVERGRITLVAPSSEVDAGALPQVDGSGKYLIPGLCDMHVHYCAPGDGALFVANGITLARNMSGAPMHLALQRQIERGERIGPRIVTASPIVEGGEPALPIWAMLRTPDGAAELVRRLAARGYQQLKVYNQVAPDTFHALCDAASSFGLRVTGHCPNTLSFEDAAQAGMTCFEHLTGVWRGHLAAGCDPQGSRGNLDLSLLRDVAAYTDFEAIRRLGQYLARHDVWNCPTLVAPRHMHEPQARMESDPLVASLLRYVPRLALRYWEAIDPTRYRREEKASGGDGAVDEKTAALRARNEVFARIVAILHEEGAPLLAGTDTAVRFVVPGFSLHHELAYLVQAGLRPYDALRCATSEAARFLGEAEDWGMLAAGKRADMVLLRADPLNDIRAVDEIEAVFRDGRYLTRAGLDVLLGEAEALAARAPDVALDDARSQRNSETGFGEIVEEGEWIERSAKAESGRLHYQQTALADGGWLIEERSVYERGDIFSIGGTQTSRTEVLLAPDCTLRTCSYRNESFVGIERWDLRWTEGEGYTVHHEDLDGAREDMIVASAPLLPSGKLSQTIWARLLAQAWELTDVPVMALNVDTGEPRIVVVTGAMERTVGAGASADDGVQVGLEFSGEGRTFLTQTVYLDGSWQVLAVREGMRELVPARAARRLQRPM